MTRQERAALMSVLPARWLVTAAIVAAGGLVLTSMIWQNEDSRPAAGSRIESALPVTVTRLSRTSDLRLEHEYTGIVVAHRTSVLSFERAARIESVSVDEGELVREGELLARQDRRRFDVQLEQLQAERDEAAAMLDELRNGARQQTLDALRQQILDLQAQTQLRQRSLDRLMSLAEKNSASEQEVDAGRFALDSAAARLESARQQLDELEEGTRVERIEAQEAVVRQLAARVRDAEIDLDDTSLRAPFTGRVSQRFTDEGVVVSPGQPILELVETTDPEIHVGLPRDVAAELSPGDVLGASTGTQSFSALLVRRIPELDPATRTQTCIFVPQGAPQAREWGTTAVRSD